MIVLITCTITIFIVACIARRYCKKRHFETGDVAWAAFLSTGGLFLGLLLVAGLIIIAVQNDGIETASELSRAKIVSLEIDRGNDGQVKMELDDGEELTMPKSSVSLVFSGDKGGDTYYVKKEYYNPSLGWTIKQDEIVFPSGMEKEVA